MHNNFQYYNLFQMVLTSCCNICNACNNVSCGPNPPSLLTCESAVALDTEISRCVLIEIELKLGAHIDSIG